MPSPTDTGAQGALCDALDDVLLVVDAESGAIRDANQTALDELEYAHENLVGRAFGAVAAVEDAHALADRIAGEDGHVEEFSVRRATGAEFPVEAAVSRAHRGGDPVLVVMARDVTERKRRERDLERYRALIDESTDVATVIDEDGTITYVSPAVRRVLGYEPADLVGENGFGYEHPEDRAAVADAIEDVLADPDATRTVEVRFRRADGDWCWIESSMRNFTDDDAVDGILVNSRDITARKAQEREHQVLSGEYEAILENSEDAIFLVDVTDPDGDPEFRFERLSSAHEDLTGLRTADVRDKRPRDVFDESVAESVAAHYRRCVERGEPVTYEETLPMPNGEIVWQTSLAPVVVGGAVDRIVGIARDVTERKARERDLERYERLVESLPIGVFQTTPGPEGEFRFSNAAMVDMFDADSEAQLHEHAISDLYRDPADRATFSETLSETGVLRGEEVELETLSGDTLWGAITAIAHDIDGETVFDGALQDVTERKRYEARLEEQRDGLELLNQVVRHDIRNDLQLVTAYAELLDDSVEDAGSREYLETVRRNAAEAIELTETARDLARVMLSVDPELEPRSLRETLLTELDALRSDHPDAEVRVDGSLPAVRVAATGMLDSVFRNLLTNAVQHNDGEHPRVSVSAAVDGDAVTVRVADDGPGVPEDRREEIFGRGNKGLDSAGTGVGLYLVRSLVDRYDGDVWVEDSDLGGAAFVVSLPTVG